MARSNQVEMFGNHPARTEKVAPRRGPAARGARRLNSLPPLELSERDIALARQTDGGKEVVIKNIHPHDEGDEVALDVRR